MSYIFDFLLFAAAGALGYLVFKKLCIPSPAILGPILTVAAINIFLKPLNVSFYLKPVLSYITGFMVGVRFSVQSKGLAKHTIFFVVWLVVLSLITAYALIASGLDAATAVFSAFPGGLAEISLMSFDYAADTLAVILLHATRLLLTMAVIPTILGHICKGSDTFASSAQEKKDPFTLKRGWPCLFAAFVLSMVFNALKLPAAMLLGSMVGSGTVTRIKKLNIRINSTFQRIVQIGIGGLVGLSITLDCVLNVDRYILPVIVLNALIFGGSTLFAVILHRLSHWDWQTCILAASPAGLSPTIMLSLEYNANSSAVTLFQVMRMLSVLVTAPVAAFILL